MAFSTHHHTTLCCVGLLACLSVLVDAHAIFYQNVCSDAACTQNCQTTEFPQNECLLTTSGNSAICYCSTLSLVQLQYVFTQNCTQYYVTEKVPLNDCVSGETEYVEYACPASVLRGGHSGAATGVASVTVKRPSITSLEGLVRHGFVTLADAPQLAQVNGQPPASHLPLVMFNGSVVVERDAAGGVLDVRCSACAPLVLPPSEITLWFRSGMTVSKPISALPATSLVTLQRNAHQYDIRVHVKGVLKVQHDTLVDGEAAAFLTIADVSKQEILSLQL